MASSLLAKSTRSVLVGKTTQPRVSRSAKLQVCHAAREMWYPGAKAPAHLDGSMLGDYGFDPLRLGTNPDLLKYFREGELTNGRWAMAAVVGMLFTDAVGLPKWWEAGALEYALPTNTLWAIELVVFALLEFKRYEGYKKTGETGVLGFFPFDPLGMKSEETKLKELKNGRLAMVAWVGFVSQAACRGLGPVESLQAHLADPGHVNLFTSPAGKEAALAVVALCTWPMLVELTKYVGKSEEPLYPWKKN